MVASASPCTSVARGEHKIMVDRLPVGLERGQRSEAKGPNPSPKGMSAGRRLASVAKLPKPARMVGYNSIKKLDKIGVIRVNTLKNV